MKHVLAARCWTKKFDRLAGAFKVVLSRGSLLSGFANNIG